MSQVVQVDEVGRLTLPPDALGNVPPRTRFVVEPREDTIVLRRVEPPSAADVALTDESTEYMARWDSLAERVGRAWKSDLTAAEAVSEARR